MSTYQTSVQKTESGKVAVSIVMDGKKEDSSSEYILSEAVKYFVVHDTDGNLSKSTVKEWKTKNFSYGQNYRGHAYIFNDGGIEILVPYSIKARATKAEWSKHHKNKAWGAMIHIELVYKGGSPSEAQYEGLAALYSRFYEANKRKKLIIVPHREIDRGIPNGHNDPSNFDFDKLYLLLKGTHGIEIEKGVDGITQERYKYVNQADMVNSFPPKLKGKPERKQ